MANGFRCAFCGGHKEDHAEHLSEQELYERGIHHPLRCQLGYTKGPPELEFDRQQELLAKAKQAQQEAPVAPISSLRH